MDTVRIEISTTGAATKNHLIQNLKTPQDIIKSVILSTARSVREKYHLQETDKMEMPPNSW